MTKSEKTEEKDAVASAVDAIVMQPTMMLRWVQVYTSTKGVPNAILPVFPKTGLELFELEQKWVCVNTGKEEWIKIEIA